MAIDTRASTSLEARLARVEFLLEADLDVLGPAVLAESIDALKERVDALAKRLDAMVAVADIVVKREPVTPAVELNGATRPGEKNKQDEVVKATAVLGARVLHMEQKIDTLLGSFEQLSRRLR